MAHRTLWRRPTAATPVLLAMALAGAACGGEEAPAQPVASASVGAAIAPEAPAATAVSIETAGNRRPEVPTGTPVVLISVDTLRADHLPAYGYGGVQTPHLDALAADSLLFENAFTSTPLTLPAHASVLTGVLPSVHAVRHNAGYTLGADQRTLTEVLAAAGYRTGGAISAFPLRGVTGIARGFEFFDDNLVAPTVLGASEVERAGDETLQAALAWLEPQVDESFFLFFHIFEPHEPYAAPEPFASRYESAYDAEVATADAIVGRLLDELERLHVYDRALIVFMSDHGEGLGDHGENDHGLFLYTSTLHVPLLLKLPRQQRAGERVAAAAQLVDIFPTVAQLLELEPPTQAAGNSLLDLADDRVGPRMIYSETYHPLLYYGWSELLSLIEFPAHYIKAPRAELYDLAGDPREQANLFERRPAEAAAMHDRLVGLDVPLEGPSPIDDATRQRLAALGYVDSGSNEAPSLADPKDKLEVLNEFTRGTELFFAGRAAEAAEAFERTLTQNPDMVSAWEFLGRAQLSLGLAPEATRSFERVRESGPTSSQNDLLLGVLYLDAGEYDKATMAAQDASVDDPARAGILRARILMARGELAAAERTLREALRLDESISAAHATLTRILLRRRTDMPEALVHAQRAIELARNEAEPGAKRNLHEILGRVQAELGQVNDAEAAFNQEIARFPDNLPAYVSLAGLYFLTGRAESGEATLRRMQEANPGPASSQAAAAARRRFSGR